MILPVVGLAWWQNRRDRVALADVRWYWYWEERSGREAYNQGHLPGAVFVDLDRQLSREGSPQEGRHPFPEPHAFAEGMAELGIGDKDTVVAYDDAGGVIAARLVWMLRVTGHQAALLDGGLGAYDGPLQQHTPPRPRAVFAPRPWPTNRLADIEDAANPANTVLDARNRDRYLGEHEPVDPRPGHIPGARNLPCRNNLDGKGRFLPVEQLRERFEDVGVTDSVSSASIVSYCGSGVTACHNLLALEFAGLGSGRLYPGSWSQYSHAIERPVATGDPR
ncbi:MAG: sulfurtransferase [Acidimicrobiales bacterium]|nr:MAG: sulfurtransferase [Acidimicrobiales bacterium]